MHSGIYITFSADVGSSWDSTARTWQQSDTKLLPQSLFHREVWFQNCRIRQSRKLCHCVKQKSSDFASCCQVLCAEISQTHLIHIYQVASV